MKKLTKTTREKLLPGVIIASVLLFLTSAIVLWENRRGTPGEPADFYYTVLRDGVELNRSAMNRDAQYGHSQYLVVDLSQTGLDQGEKAEILQKLGEDCADLPDLTVLDLPMGDRGSYFHDRLVADVSAVTGASVDDLLHNAGLYPLTFTVKTPLPPRERFGVEPMTVSYLMWWGGWKGRSDVTYLHYPLAGWRWTSDNFKGTEYQIS